jgi:WD40 repeat protein
VLIDDGGNAVLCDFGLSRIKADTTSRTMRALEGSLVGSRNWMAPEQLLGEPPKWPCDIYAFGMTLYEVCITIIAMHSGPELTNVKIFANEIPLGHIIYADFVELVTHQNIRPQRPDNDDAPQLSDRMWKLAEKCWVNDPKQRPTASTVCDTLSHVLDTTTTIRPTSNAPPSHTISDTRPTRPSTLPDDLTIRGHATEVYCAAFSPDGKYVVSGSADGTLQVWDAQTGDLHLGPLKMKSAVICVTFFPNCPRIASASVMNGVSVWSAVTGNQVESLIINAGSFGAYSGGYYDDEYGRYDGQNSSAIWSIGISPDGKKLALGSDNSTICVRDVLAQDHNTEGLPQYRSPRPRRRRSFSPTQPNVTLLQGHTEGVTSVVFSPDGTRIVSGSYDWTVRVWDGSGELIHGPLRGHNDTVDLVAFSPNGKSIISVSMGTDICVWNTDTGDLVSGPLKRHAECSLSVAFVPSSTPIAISPDGKWIAMYIGNSYRTVEVWDLGTGQLAATFKMDNCDDRPDMHRPHKPRPHKPRPHKLNSAPPRSTDWSFLGMSSIPSSSEKLQMLSPSHNRTNNAHGFTFSPDSKRILLPSHDGSVRIQSFNQ